jgi:hypothetical protein
MYSWGVNEAAARAWAAVLAPHDTDFRHTSHGRAAQPLPTWLDHRGGLVHCLNVVQGVRLLNVLQHRCARVHGSERSDAKRLCVCVL